jgi:uncharacterized protein YecT (DUF1311 family)
VRRLLLALLCMPAAAGAQYAGPAVEACRAHAQQEQAQGAIAGTRVVIDNDRHLGIERYSRKLGSQPVASLLYGNGAIAPRKGQAVEMSFVCLLADEKRALFFYWIPRLDAAALAQCTRGAKENAAECLDSLLQVIEQDLTQAYAARFQEARDADARSGGEAASNALRESNKAWLAYRDAECARRAAADERKACVADLSRRRLIDVR